MKSKRRKHSRTDSPDVLMKKIDSWQLRMKATDTEILELQARAKRLYKNAASETDTSKAGQMISDGKKAENTADRLIKTNKGRTRQLKRLSDALSELRTSIMKPVTFDPSVQIP